MVFSQISRTIMQNLCYINRHTGRTVLKLVTCKHVKLQCPCLAPVKCLADFSSKIYFYTTDRQSRSSSEFSTKHENDEVLISDSERTNNDNSDPNPRTWLQNDKDHQVYDVKSAGDHSDGEYRLILEEEDSDLDTEVISKQQSDLQPMSKHEVKPRFHLAAYVGQSETLTQLVRLGVDLTQVQRVRDAADMIIKLDFEAQVKPYLFFLHDVGVSDEVIGNYISKNPLIFKEDMEDLQARIQYLKSKRFTNEAISRIVSKAHVYLLMPVRNIDAKLGYLQKQYRLTGDEVRSVVTRLPKLISWNQQKLKDNRFYIKEFLGFSNSELTQLMIACPKMFLTDRYALGKKFDYLYNTMEISHSKLVEWPNVFRTRLHIIQQRHRFLLSVDRAQYDPAKENFVSLKALVSGTDTDFCKSVAKVSVTQYNNFLKSI